MNSRERFLRTMRFQTVDHPILALPGPWPGTRKRWEREGCPAGVDLHEYFGIEPLGMRQTGIETVLYPPFEEIILEETPEYVIRINHNGVKEKNFPDHSSMPEWLEYPIKGPESLPWLREKLNWNTPGRVKPTWLEDSRKALAEGVSVSSNGGMYFGFLNEHMGTEPLLLAYYDKPEFIHEVNELTCRLCEETLRTVLPHFKLDYIGYHEDMAYKNGPMISPAFFREFMTPYYRRIQKITEPYGIDLHVLDSDGNISELIPLWLECGIQVLSPMEVAAGMDVAALRKQYGKALCMMGGFDKRILATTKPRIIAELERLRPVWEEGGYVPGIDHGVPPDVSWENACCYVRTLKAMFGMN